MARVASEEELEIVLRRLDPDYHRLFKQRVWCRDPIGRIVSYESCPNWDDHWEMGMVVRLQRKKAQLCQKELTRSEWEETANSPEVVVIQFYAL